MNDIVDKLGLVELPFLEILEEVLWYEIRSQNQSTEEEIQRIVLTYGRALKAAIDLRAAIESEKEKKNVNGQ